MVYEWEPGTQYDLGSVVEYQGHKYKVIQPHRSQGDWTPSVTPALWGRLPEDFGGGCQQPVQQQWLSEKQGYEPSYNQPNQNQQNQPQPPPPTQQGGYPSGDVKVEQHEQKKNWWDLDDKRKQELEIGGGLLAGAAAIGAGYFAFKEHKKNDEEKKALTWALQNWLQEAKQRTADYQQNGPRGPFTWILNEGKTIPPGAIRGGEERGGPLYICRAFHDGGIQLGKASPVFKKGAVIGFHKEEIHLSTYEILVGDERAVRWVGVTGTLNLATLGAQPVEGGREDDGTPLYIAQAPHHGAVHPGKASTKLDGAYIPYDNSEKKVKEYRVLCYA